MHRWEKVTQDTRFSESCRTMQGSRRPGAESSRSSLLKDDIWDRKTADRTVYANMNGKVPGNPEFECWSIEPAGPWNYALCSDPVIPLKVIRTKPAAAGSYPFDPEHTPVKISVPVKPIDWELEKGRYTPRLPAEGIARAVSDRIEYLELIPYGCTELRLTVFPQCN